MFEVSSIENGTGFIYPIFKIILGVVCFILGIEYAWTYCVYEAASFGILYVADTFTWLSAGTILFTEGIYAYIKALKQYSREINMSTSPTR